jgi:hypothetical protein
VVFDTVICVAAGGAAAWPALAATVIETAHAIAPAASITRASQ